MCGVEISDLPCLVSGRNLNLTSGDMTDIRRQEIVVNDKNNPASENIPAPKNIPLQKLEEDYSWRP